MSVFRIHELHNREYFRTLAECCRETFHYSNKDVDSLVGKMLAGNSSKIEPHVIYAECLGEMAGFLIFYYHPKNKVGFLEALVVMDNYRNQGIGSQMYWSMVELLREQHPECIGHILEMCRDEINCVKRKKFFLAQGCIPVDLRFFFSDPQMGAIRLLYHPYRADQQYSLGLMEEILREINSDTIH